MALPSKIWEYLCSSAVVSVAVDSLGNVFAGDASGKLTKISPDGVKVWEYNNINIVQCLAIDKDDNIYFGEYADSNNKVFKFSPLGVEIWSYTCESGPWGGGIFAVKADDQGNVYTGDSVGNTTKISPLGAKIWDYSSGDTYVKGIAVDAEGNVYSADENSIARKLNSNGELVWETLCQDTLNCIDIDSSSNVYVGDYNYGVTKISPLGAILWTHQADWSVFGVVVDNFDNIYYGDWSKNVVKLTIENVVTWTYVNESSINGLTSDSKGGIYIAGDSGKLTKINDPDIVVADPTPAFPYEVEPTLPVIAPTTNKIKATVYDSMETDFKNNGLTVLNECISCFTIEELNGGYSLEMEYPVDERKKYLNLVGLNIVKGDSQLFRIPFQDNVQNNGLSVKITANHVFYDSHNDYNEDVRAENKTVAEALTIAIATNPKFSVAIEECDDLGLGTAYFIGESPKDSIFNKILPRWNGELYRDNYKIAVKGRLGKDTGRLIKYGKDIEGFTQKLDWSGLATKILPKGKDGLTIDLINGGSKYLVSPRVGDYPFVVTKEIKFENIEDATELKNAALALWGVIDLPKGNFTVKFTNLEKTEEYKQFKDLLKLKIGDGVIIRHKVFKCDLSARIIKIKKNILTEEIEEMELGQFKENINNKFNNMDKQIAFTQGSLLETREDLKLTKTTVFQNDERITLQAEAIDTVEGRVDDAFLEITAESIMSKVSSSETYINDLGEKVTAAQASTISQTAENVKIGFNDINDNVVFDQYGMAINNGAFTLKNGSNTVVIDGTHNIHKILIEGTVSFDVTDLDTDKTISINHNLGYKPVIACYQNGSGGVDQYGSFPALTIGGTSGGIVIVMRSRCDNTNLYIDYKKLEPAYSFVGTIYIKYFIYKEVAF